MDIFEFSKDADDMNEGELRATLVDLVAKHNEQVADTDDYEDQIEDLESDVEAYREDAEAAVAFFAELVGSQKDMDPELLAEKFSATELQEQIDEDAFSLVEGESEESEEEAEETTFDNKPEKSDNHPGEDDHAQYRDDARAALQRLGIAAYEDDN